MLQVDVPKGRDGKYKHIITQLLAKIVERDWGSALKIIADTLSIILLKSGFTTVTAYDGVSALKLAETARPELLISDVVMQGMTGVELAIALTQLVPECKVLLFSGQAATVDL